MSSNPREREDQPPLSNATPFENKDTQYGNPEGDVVDNSQGTNLTNSKINPARQQSTGASLSHYAKSPIFYGIGGY